MQCTLDAEVDEMADPVTPPRDHSDKEGEHAAWQYERLFVPAEFREWAPRVLDAARVETGHRVLDVACGTGVLAREAAARVGGEGRVIGVDVDSGMLGVAAAQAPRIEWRRAHAEALPFADGVFDRVVSQFGLMFFSDRQEALLEMRRVLAPGGRLAVAVWDTLEHTPAYARFAEVLTRVDPAAGAALGAPFSLGELDQLAELFESAGLMQATIQTHVGAARFPNIRTMVEAEIDGWMPMAGIVLSPEQRQRVLADAEVALAELVLPDGTVRFDAPAHIVSTTVS
jgi:ubiquinone/menaquinone biosynthesis C-methylase UbiE